MALSALEVIKGTVVKFAGNGRKLGYPTANLNSETGLADGVYFGRASMGAYKNQPTLIFIGTPTTVGDTVRRVEAHLLDIKDADYYDQELALEVQHFYRPNINFDSVDKLISAMKLDEEKAREWFVGQ